tara:strand:+ start:1780 stop:1935 length:156 start_codon:yes stop_codon:yes gene_type:complete
MIKLKDVLGLEIHKYAPELNKLHLMNGAVFNTPQITKIDDAIKKVNYENSK